LYREHEDKLSEDVTDAVWKLLGSAVHHILEQAHEEEGVVLEQRDFSVINVTWVGPARDYVLSGAVDLRDGRKVTDYKVTATYTYIRAEFDEWTAQLNMYDWLLWKNGHEGIEELEVVVILRDWMKSKRKGKNYPDAPVKVVPIERWTHKYQEEFIEERIQLHTAENVRPCTQEETWDGIRCRSWCPVRDFCPQFLGA
jgi:hypothetical protein